MDKITTSREFANPYETLTWVKVQEGMEEAILYRDEDSGSYCRLLKVAPNFDGGADTPLCHDFDEMVYIISGGLINKRLNEEYETGSFAVFPAQTKHGPMSTGPSGGVTLEMRHYRK